MTKSLEQLIDIAYDIKVYLGLNGYELNQFEDGSYIDFHVQKITCPEFLIKLARELDIKIFHDERSIIIRLFEEYED